ncbi:glycosyltransferase involved in cell wall biosynthesis [Neorhizobium huautlense]|uniref:Glycosyltransferase involved in cell wall biosynthesis n=1 Tax=Neorhizobium huautlense TaxID=67774 RepID=A0ABT9Q1G1_9HYPH|nr:rhamnan synthesis F family protein [Neorhizobium huautlense]MDP9839829.1 glycosyltransferase involved in cell wall biosynthesis [Neorhizobium huautlense]
MKHYVLKVLRNERNKRIAKDIVSRSRLLETLSQRFLSKHPKNHIPAVQNEEWLNEIIVSGLFDINFYQNATGRVFASSRDAILDYITDGEKRYLRPSAQFDPLVYRFGHQDLRDLQSSLLMHYVRHGRYEKRLAVLDFDAISSAGRRPFERYRPTVLLASHEASMTGAPILGCNIAEQLATKFNVISLIMKDGILVDEFHEHSSLVLLAPEGAAGLDSSILRRVFLSEVKQRFGLDYVIANSIETANIAAAAQELNVPVVSLMHEFAEYVIPQKRVLDMVVGSQMIVFSSSVTAASALNCNLFNGFRNYLVLPQGKSKIPVTSSIPTSRQLADLLRLQSIERRFLVIGCGFVQIRKGVDIFISTAQRLVQKLGRDKVRFVWVGDGYDPEKDLSYSIWLRDQIVRGGLQDLVTIMPGVSADDLENLYIAADAMLMSSRLDPFPNVTIDAMQAGLPVVSFEKASGTAEFLRNIAQFKPLVAPYLDVEAAADILERLAIDTHFRREIGVALKAMALEAFDMRRYVNKLIAILEDAKSMSAQERLDFDTLSQAGALSDAAIGDALGAVSSPDEKIKKYLRFAASGVEGVDRIYRRPVMGFSPHIYLEHHPELNKAPFENHLAHWIRNGRPEGRWFRHIIRLGAEPKVTKTPSKLKVALHIHLHYPEILDEILKRIQHNLAKPDLLISVTSDKGLSYVSRRLAGYKKARTVIRRVPNLGRDLGPMITEYGAMLDDYDVVGHIHGKKSVDIGGSGATAQPGDIWREFLFENLIGGKAAAIDEILAAFEQRSDLGLVFPEDPNVVGWTENYLPATELCERLGVHADLPRTIEFPVGNMFYARPRALAPIFNSGLRWDDYPEEPLGYDGTMLHALERITPTVCEAQGYRWVTTEVEGFNR